MGIAKAKEQLKKAMNKIERNEVIQNYLDEIAAGINSSISHESAEGNVEFKCKVPEEGDKWSVTVCGDVCIGFDSDGAAEFESASERIFNGDDSWEDSDAEKLISTMERLYSKMKRIE